MRVLTYALALAAAVLTVRPACAQLQLVGDEYMLVATLEFLGAAGKPGPIAVCESRLGYLEAGTQSSRVNTVLEDGSVVVLELALDRCNRLLIQPTFWAVDESVRAFAEVKRDGAKRVLWWAQQASVTVPVDGRVLIGSAVLSPDNAVSHSMNIFLGIRRLAENGN